MKRRILWQWGKLNKETMETAYARAEKNGDSDILEMMEERALAEAKAHCVIIPGAFLYVNHGEERIKVTPETFDKLNEGEVEGVICFLGKVGLMKREESGKNITILTTPAILKCPSCAAFQLMEELENIDGKTEEMSYKICVGGKNDFLGVCMGFLKKTYPWADIDVILQSGKKSS
ncbi:MAG: hypothetical protein IJS35_05800 [Firmicutes bacterium]|nr:hypothetical protein [Bacillota bacterium]